jgi:antitoxin HicB
MSANDEQQGLSKRYSIIIEWSDEDGAYIVTLPEFPTCHTHGATREEALKNGQEVLELLVEEGDWDRPLPPPNLFAMDALDGLEQRPSNEHAHQVVSVEVKA